MTSSHPELTVDTRTEPDQTLRDPVDRRQGEADRRHNPLYGYIRHFGERRRTPVDRRKGDRRH